MGSMIYKQELGKLAPTLEFITESDNDKNSNQQAVVDTTVGAYFQIN